MVQQLSLIKNLNTKSKYFEDLYDIFWKISEGEKITKHATKLIATKHI